MQEKKEMQGQSLDREGPLERKWQPTPVFLPGKSQGQRSLEGYIQWSHKELDMAAQIHSKDPYCGYTDIFNN